MRNQQHKVPTRTGVRQRRERLLSVIAAATLFVGWYLSAALDARLEREFVRQPPNVLPTAFDAAFVAANGLDERRSIGCVDAGCSRQLAQAEVLQAQL